MMFNYAFSGWIANFGVVPLFSLAFFLFAPAFFLFILRRVFVCVVFEDIVYSFLSKIIHNNKRIYLSIFIIVVKVFVINNTYANTTKKDHFLAKGEQFELSTQNLKNFSVGNKEVLKYRYLPQKAKILIKGQKLGFSDLIIWDHLGKKHTHHFYITSKREQLKKMEIAQIFKNTSLKTKISGEMIFISGELQQLKTYFLFKKLMGQMKKTHLIFDVRLAPSLTKKIIAKIYRDFYSERANLMSCKELNTQIDCLIRSPKKHDQLIQFFKKHFFISFKYFEESVTDNNYILKFKIVSVDSHSTQVRNTDFNKIDTSLTNLIQERRPFNGDHILMQDQNIFSSLVAAPEINVVFDKDFKVQLGAEVPIPTHQGVNRTAVQWKFVGLSINGKLSVKQQHYILSYNSFITQTGQGDINGPKGQSSLYLSPGKLVKLYSINLQRKGLNSEELPLLSNIPFIRSLFMKKSDRFSHRKVIFYVYLEEI